MGPASACLPWSVCILDTFPGRLDKVHRGFFQSVTLLRDSATRLRSASSALVHRREYLRPSTSLRASPSALSRYRGCEYQPQKLRDLGARKPTLGHMLTRCDLEFFYLPLFSDTFSLCLNCGSGVFTIAVAIQTMVP
jgi:hypothetical protein